MTTPPATTSRSLLKGLAAGLIGGLAGAAAMSVVEKFYSHQEQPQQPSIAALAKGDPWTFGPLMGAAYGALAELAPAVTDRRGVTFGVALCSLTVEGALPSSGLSAAKTHLPLSEQPGELIAFSVYGLVTEAVRQQVRKLL
ncbi:MAG: DUF1440 domain-containing protein [Acidobacteriaceae bacterium]